jgi:hypothetical protein
MADEKDLFGGLVGKEFKFYGVDNCCMKLGNQVFEAVEDESDGYRSYLGSIEVIDLKSTNLIFPRYSFANVRVEEDWGDVFQGYILRDVLDGHEWLRFGTDYCDDYYPVFRFQYQAKKPA